MALRPQSSKPDKAAKRKAAEQDVFVREVDEALRQDEMAGWFNRYGLPVIAIVVVSLGALGGWLWWQHSQQQAAEERGEQFVVALDQLEAGNLASADERFATIAQEGGGASAAAAMLMQAGIALEQDRRDAALKLYGQVATDADAPQPYRDLALVRQVAANFDEMEPQEVIDRLKPLAAPGNPWFGVAGELVGIAYLKQDKPDLAGPLFAQIARDEETPQSLRGRARQLAGVLGVDAIDDAMEDGDRQVADNSGTGDSAQPAGSVGQ